MIDAYHKVIQDWLPKDKDLLPFYAGINDVLKDLLVKHQDEDEETQPKIIADPLLGYIHLDPLEISIVDTKLFQRLRKIKQLGLAYLVFPSLSYSRFEHSLGVLGRLNQIINKLIENNLRRNKDDNLKSIIDKYLTSIRLAALLHDIGHCLFSHCSERVIEKCKGSENYPSASYIQDAFSKHFRNDKKIALAEILSISIIGSRSFYQFIKQVSELNEKKIEKILKCCGMFILGLPSEKEKEGTKIVQKDPDTVFLAQLISSGLDADKIDYMLREQHYTGIKLEIDLDRILSKLNIFSLKSYEVPVQLGFLKNYWESNTEIKVLGFEKGGQFAFEEFCIARLALHVKIYLHQKIRGAEAQLSKYLEGLIESPLLCQVHNWLRVPETIIEFPELLNRYTLENNLFTTFTLDGKTDCFKKIDQREIVHRAFAFGPINSYSERHKNEDEYISEKLEVYFENFKADTLKQTIVDEAIKICDENGIEANFKLFNEIIVEIPRLLNIQQGQESLYFERASYLPVRWTIPIDKIIIYFQENRALAYIFSPKEVAHIISLVSEKVVFDLAKKVYSQEGYLSRKTYENSQLLKNNLSDKAYYNTYPQLKPISAYLTNAFASEIITSIHENLKGFRSFNDEYITINRITTFVNQFPEDLQDACLDFLKNVDIYSEHLLAEELNKLLTSLNANETSIAVCPLGSATDSGNRLTYGLRNVFENHQIERFELNDNVILESEKLILYDDNINSGLQLINIFAELLDEKSKLPKEFILDEKHHRKLFSPVAKSKFKEMPIYITYIVGFEGIEAKIQEILTKYLGFKNPENLHIKIHREFTQSGKILTGPESRFQHKKKQELKDFLTQIGEKLLRSENKSESKISTCKLGYSQAEAVVFFPYNVPTMTVTALWCKGILNNIPWIPLAERRRRSKDGKYLGED